MSTVPLTTVEEAERLVAKLEYGSLAEFCRKGLDREIAHAQKILKDRARRARAARAKRPSATAGRGREINPRRSARRAQKGR